MSSNLDFYRRRKMEELALAEGASDMRVRDIHVEMALCYARLIEIEAEQPHLAVVKRAS